MDVTATAIPEVKIIEPRRFGDDRGLFCETYNRVRFAEHGIDADFVQDNQSLSRQVGTLRGLHFQSPPHAQAKLVRVLAGRVLDVAVDIRHGSPTFGQHVAVELSAENWRQLFVPKGFAHAFCTLEPDTVVAYKVDDLYAPDCDGGIRWNDPALGIDWPVTPETVQLSTKDAALPVLSALAPLFRY